MLKKVAMLLLAFTLVLNLTSNVVIASANEGSMFVVLNDPNDDELEEVNEDNDNDNEDDNAQIFAFEQDDAETEDDEDLDLESSDEEEDVEADEASAELPEASVDAMRTFLEENSEDNPFIIPAGLDFLEAINALDWGEGVKVSPALTGYDSLYGAIALMLISETEEENTYDDEYWFFEVGVFVQYEDEDDDEESPSIPQASIEAMQEFIENNSADNPFNIPAGLNFTEAINALDWGEGITVSPIMSSHGLESGLVRGSLFLHLNQQLVDDEVTYDAEYGFLDIVIYYEMEESQDDEDEEKEPTDPPPPAGQTPEQPPARVLPQTGTEILNMSLIGGGILAVGGLLIYLRNRNKK